ncbi:adenylate/guanylate cyclase domain-containing protein [Oceanibacterium hippocampi]|uniref:Adenylate cyclase 1 n=1 Tax=Oceanibacterium hippocampi TaxID=745714 RepID=A0A1Y5SNF3_9PROT|nr:adenylate/guanylate cyclase domain-containing protein [Oceanibacterium hippocampi]SLN43549.1 Adenylate cyclase 1 [Oceanibacterium hippocampi]
MTLVGMLSGALFGVIVSDGELAGALRGAATGGPITALLLTLEVGLLNAGNDNRFRRLPFTALLAFRTLCYLAVFIGGLWFGEAVVPIDDARGTIGWNSQTLISLAFASALGLLFNIYFAIRRLLGPGVLARFVTGRYHRPREEKRIFLFIDLKGSTEIAERIGPLEFHRLMNDVIYAVTRPILSHRGEIHKYVGDEIIVTWPMAGRDANARALDCVAACHRALVARSPVFEKRYGVSPGFWAGLHGGPVVTGEMGDVRQEIVFLGDTVNTAARIEQSCRTLGHDCLLSESLLGELALPAWARPEALGPVSLRGKTEPVALYALALD